MCYTDYMGEQRTNREISNDNLIRFKPDQSGNPKGREPSSVGTLLKNVDNLTNQQIADMIVERVLAGEFCFVKEYLDRTEGKVTEKRISVSLTAVVTPELLKQAQERLSLSIDETTKLLEE